MALKHHLVEDLENGWTRGTAAGDSVPPLQRALGACLLRIAQLARQLPPAGFLRACMLALRDQVAFDAAWWGEMTGVDAAPPPRNLLHASIGLRATFAQEWNRDLAPLDTFAQSTMDNLDTVFRASGGYRGPPGVVADFIDRHRLHSIMTLTVALADGGPLFFICLYRHDPQAAFSDDESEFFADYTRHVALAWQHRAGAASLTSAATSSSPLSPRERGAALLYAQGHTNKEVARLLGLSPATVRTYLRDAYRVLECSNKVELLAALGRQQRDY
jgi:DNA-binding CsgD family transcriptional regulator